MKKICWNSEKSQLIQDDPSRGVSLELIAEYIQNGDALGTMTRSGYPEQEAFILPIGEMIWCVPFREDENYVYLITAWPDRNLKRKYHERKT